MTTSTLFGVPQDEDQGDIEVGYMLTDVAEFHFKMSSTLKYAEYVSTNHSYLSGDTCSISS